MFVQLVTILTSVIARMALMSSGAVLPSRPLPLLSLIPTVDRTIGRQTFNDRHAFPFSSRHAAHKLVSGLCVMDVGDPHRLEEEVAGLVSEIWEGDLVFSVLDEMLKILSRFLGVHRSVLSISSNRLYPALLLTRRESKVVQPEPGRLKTRSISPGLDVAIAIVKIVRTSNFVPRLFDLGRVVLREIVVTDG